MSRYWDDELPDYVAHHGILGMKWGVRRYQNPDGTLTNAGKKRYSKNFNKKYDDYTKAKRGYERRPTESNKRFRNALANDMYSSMETDMFRDLYNNISNDYDTLYKVGRNGTDFDDEYDYVRPGASKKYKKAYKQYQDDVKAYNDALDMYFPDDKTRGRVWNALNDLNDYEKEYYGQSTNSGSSGNYSSVRSNTSNSDDDYMKRIKRNTSVATLIGGPAAGIVAGAITAKRGRR